MDQPARRHPPHGAALGGITGLAGVSICDDGSRPSRSPRSSASEKPRSRHHGTKSVLSRLSWALRPLLLGGTAAMVQVRRPSKPSLTLATAKKTPRLRRPCPQGGLEPWNIAIVDEAATSTLHQHGQRLPGHGRIAQLKAATSVGLPFPRMSTRSGQGRTRPWSTPGLILVAGGHPSAWPMASCWAPLASAVPADRDELCAWKGLDRAKDLLK